MSLLILLSVLPAAGLLAAYPRRPWAAWAGAALTGAVGAALTLSSPEGLRPIAGALALWSSAAALYGVMACGRGLAERRGREAEVAAARRRREEFLKALVQARARGARSGLEQRETLALYGMIKSLSEALSWEEIKPKLETAVDQYLGLSEFALYAAGLGGAEDVLPITARQLSGSPAASWAALERCLQEQGLSRDEPHLLVRPERAVFLPVRDGKELLGFFYARVPQKAEASAEELFAKARTFASEIAFAFRRVKLYQEVERLSQIDGLTGVCRRGVFDDRLRHETVRAQTFKTSFGLMLLDIDHFKSLNDRFGHPFGDQVLRRVGEILNAAVYETDLVARYGGEEFVVILPRAEPAGVLRKAEQIRLAIQGERFAIALETVTVTVSIGIAHFPRDASGPDELVGAADQAMYQAKSRGRNLVVDYATLKSAR